MSQVEHLQPVLVVNQEGPALWRLADGPLALALFSDAARAAAYAARLADQAGKEPDAGDADSGDADGAPGSTAEAAALAWQVKQPNPTQTVRILAACVRGGIHVAALNPQDGTAQRLFDLAEILRDVRGRLQRGEPLRF